MCLDVLGDRKSPSFFYHDTSNPPAMQEGISTCKELGTCRPCVGPSYPYTQIATRQNARHQQIRAQAWNFISPHSLCRSSTRFSRAVIWQRFDRMCQLSSGCRCAIHATSARVFMWRLIVAVVNSFCSSSSHAICVGVVQPLCLRCCAMCMAHTLPLLMLRPRLPYSPGLAPKILALL
jgi:hypothetical protein